MKARRRENESADESAGGSFNSAASTESARLLVIEDEPDLQELLRYNLTRRHYEVMCTDRGERGLEVCRALREEAATARIPVLTQSSR